MVTDVSHANHVSHHIFGLSVGKFNQGVSAEAKKATWIEITNQINGLGENHREVCSCGHRFSDVSDAAGLNLQAACVTLRYTLSIDIKSTFHQQFRMFSLF